LKETANTQFIEVKKSVVKQITRDLNDIHIPKEFKIKVDDMAHHKSQYADLTLNVKDNKNTISIDINIYVDVKGENAYILDYDGWGSYKGDDGQWYVTYRLGVDSSFASDYENKIHSIKNLLENLGGAIYEEIDRIEKEKNDTANYIKVPDTDFQIPPEKLEQMKKQLKSGKMAQLTPSGFGKAYIFGKKISKSQYGVHRCSDKQEKFFGITQLYYYTEDHD